MVAKDYPFYLVAKRASCALEVQSVRSAALRETERSISFRSESRSEISTPRPWSRNAPPAITKRRDSKLWSETFDVRVNQMLSAKEIKRQEGQPVTQRGVSVDSVQQGQPVTQRGVSVDSVQQGQPVTQRGVSVDSVQQGQPVTQRGVSVDSVQQGQPVTQRGVSVDSVQQGQPVTQRHCQLCLVVL
ncbi:UNVERIFIED_CONTAM: hypothetical protein FKN15_028019 [Acipenser sinensis]